MTSINLETNFLPMGTEFETAHNVRANVGSGDSPRQRRQKERFNDTASFIAGDGNWDVDRWESELRNRGFDWVQVKEETTNNVAAEIVTPTFSPRSTAAKADIRRLLNTIEEMGGCGWRQYRWQREIHVGMHCHVGNAPVDGSALTPDAHWTHAKDAMATTGRFDNGALADVMPLALAKDVIARYAANESELNACFPAWRRTSNGSNWACRSISHVADGSGYNRFWQTGGDSVADAADAAALVLCRNPKFAVASLDTWARLGTVEFRQAPMTLSADKLWQWLTLLENLFMTSASGRIDWDAIGGANDTRQTPDQLFRRNSRIGLIYSMCRRDGGATVQEIISATGWDAETIRPRITEIRQRLDATGHNGQAAVVTHNQQVYGNAYGASNGRHDLNGYEVLREYTVRNAAADIPLLPVTRRAPATIWYGLSDDCFEYWQGRKNLYSSR